MTKRFAGPSAIVVLTVLSVSAWTAPRAHADANKVAFECMAVASIGLTFGAAKSPLARLRGDESFKKVNEEVIARGRQRLTPFSEKQILESLAPVVSVEAKAMSDRVFLNGDLRISEDELVVRMKRYITARFESLGCLSE